MGNMTSDGQPPTFTWGRVKSSFRKKQKWKTLASLVKEKEIDHEFDTSDSALLQVDDIMGQETVIQDGSCDFHLQHETTLNVPVVLACSTILHQRDCNKIYLPLGTILRAMSKFKDWLYVETVYGEDGYIESEICLPLEKSSLLTTSSSLLLGIEMSPFVTTDSNANPTVDDTINYSERNVDILYLQAAVIQRQIKHLRKNSPRTTDDNGDGIKLTVRNDYVENGSQTMSVRRGEVVHLLHAKIRGWFWIRNHENNEGFIPATITTYRFK